MAIMLFWKLWKDLIKTRRCRCHHHLLVFVILNFLFGIYIWFLLSFFTYGSLWSGGWWWDGVQWTQYGLWWVELNMEKPFATDLAIQCQGSSQALAWLEQLRNRKTSFFNETIFSSSWQTNKHLCSTCLPEYFEPEGCPLLRVRQDGCSLNMAKISYWAEWKWWRWWECNFGKLQSL